MNLREEIISKLNYSAFSVGQIDIFHDSIKTDAIGHANIDMWLKGCIESLFYRPNKYCLVFCGSEHQYYYIQLIEGIISESGFLTCLGTNSTSDCELYSRQIFCINFSDLEYYSKVKQISSLCEQDGFICTSGTIDDWPKTDKRLASYCGVVSKWSHPQRKNMLVVNIESIDFGKLQEVNKHLLWIELFYKYKIF